MDESFSIEPTPPERIPLGSPSGGNPERETLRVLLIGSRRVVTSTIHHLYGLGFAEVGEWTRLLPGPNPGEVMSILTRNMP